jgi:NAD(P)-dependent dehydrogenase (short-subunit alcohol dehydrogenase family)
MDQLRTIAFAVCAGIIEPPLIEGVLSKLKDRKAAEEYFLSLHPIGRLGRPEEIAHAVLFLCDDNVEFMTGAMLSVDGGWIAR